MNILDEVLQEIIKEYEKERNNHKDYASQEDLKEFKIKNNITDTQNIEKEVVDNRKDLNKHDMVRIINGDYKGITKECKVLDFVESMDKVLIQTDEFNRLYVNPKDIELVRKTKKEYTKDIYNKVEARIEKIKVIENGDLIKIILENGTESLRKIKNEVNKDKIILAMYYGTKANNYEMLKTNCLKFDN